MGKDLLSQLRAQVVASRTLEAALASGAVHHAYLFAGPDGVGKELAAFGLAQALVCERRGASAGPSLFGEASSPSPRACGECSACVRAVPQEGERTPVHPDVVVLERGLYPMQAIGRRTPETQEISIDQVRTLVLSRAAYAPHESHAKVFVVRRAEELSVSAANALLKTLEEPGPRTHFILLTSQPDSLLPTILSRTLRLRFAPLPDDLVAELLVARGVVGARAEEMARLSHGSMAAALALADPTESDAREDFVRQALDAALAPTLEPSLALAEASKKAKERLPTFLKALADALAARATEAAERGAADAEAWAARGLCALTALDHLERNGAAQLVVEAMMLRMRSAA